MRDLCRFDYATDRASWSELSRSTWLYGASLQRKKHRLCFPRHSFSVFVLFDSKNPRVQKLRPRQNYDRCWTATQISRIGVLPVKIWFIARILVVAINLSTDFGSLDNNNGSATDVLICPVGHVSFGPVKLGSQRFDLIRPWEKRFPQLSSTTSNWVQKHHVVAHDLTWFARQLKFRWLSGETWCKTRQFRQTFN